MCYTPISYEPSQLCTMYELDLKGIIMYSNPHPPLSARRRIPEKKYMTPFNIKRSSILDLFVISHLLFIPMSTTIIYFNGHA